MQGTLCLLLALACQPVQAQLAEKPALVIVVGGIGGIDLVGPALRLSSPHVGLHHEVRNFIWTHGVGQFFKDLQDAPHTIRKAEELAHEIRRAREADPDRPIYLVGKSGGAGLSLMAAEQLPPETLERIILLNAAVTPSYDLRSALRAVKGELVSFYSPADWLILGWGTWQFGTIDRVHGPSAGLCGFVKPAGLSPEDQALYSRVVQVAWSPAMICEGYTGGHFGTCLPGFVGKEVAPWLKP
jgi:pimeloyl-ACP methyl ester carboxylesterase